MLASHNVPHATLKINQIHLKEEDINNQEGIH